MADRLEWFDVTIPAGTPISAPLSIPLVFNQGEVTEIDVKVLDGPEGSVGFFITAGGSQYVPRTTGNYVIPNNDYFTWPVHNAINSGSWGIVAYNTDVWDHMIQVAFQVNEIGGNAADVASAAVGPVALPVSAIMSGTEIPDSGPASDASLLADLSEQMSPA